MNYDIKIMGDESEKKPDAMNVHEQLLFQLQQGKKLNPFSELLGQWPGDETDEEFEEILKGMGK